MDVCNRGTIHPSHKPVAYYRALVSMLATLTGAGITGTIEVVTFLSCQEGPEVECILPRQSPEGYQSKNGRGNVTDDSLKRVTHVWR